MPLYTLENTKTGELETMTCSYDEMKSLVSSGKYTYVPGAPRIVSGTGTITGKIDSGFNDVLTRIKKANRGSTIQTK
jgi:hypothetical protein